VTVTGATTFGLDSIIEMEHEYTPISSRNNFSGAGNKTADKVDVFVDGEDPVTVIEQFPMPTHGDVLFGSDVASAYFLRDDGVDIPQTDNLYTQLSKSPIVALPSSISVAATNTQAATTYNKDEDYWLVSNNDDPTGLEGSPRASNGIEWKSPTTIDFTSETPTFAATIQSVAGKLGGYYTYKLTYDIDGVESLPSAEKHPSSINVLATDGRNALSLATWGGAGSTVWRKVYRSKSSATLVAAQAGPWYLAAVIKNNVATSWLDNKPDSGLGVLQPPKAPPEASSLVTVEYSYNRLIERLDAQMDQVRLVGMDVLTHEADDLRLKFNLAVVLVPGMSTTDVEADVNTILTAWINRKNFRNNIQIADVVEQVGQSSGIDNVRLAQPGEEKNEVQKVAVTTTRAAPDATKDLFTITIGGYTTGPIPYNEDSVTVREVLEALPNIHEGNTYATQLNGAINSTNATSFAVDDNPGMQPGGILLQSYFVQVGSEVMEVVDVVDNGGTLTLTVKRGQLGTIAATHLTTSDVHILGDVAVAKSTSGTTTTFTISFLPNAYTGVNDWGSRKLDLATASKYPADVETSKVTTAVTRKVQGAGSGIQVIAANGTTVVRIEYDDFYLDSDELPSIIGVNLIPRASNTF
jgi:hypothetical protein